MKHTAWGLFLLMLLTACASQPQERTQLSWDATRMRADAYYNQGQILDALPLYEELQKKEPKNPYYATRLAWCLLVKFESLPTGKERTAGVARAKAMAERAKALGENSDLTRTILERVNSPDALQNRNDAKLQAAEALFARGDMDGALAAYKAIAAEDPKSYAAHLFAGDVYFVRHDYTHAGEWFAQAIAISPNTETAYRYWADALLAAGDNDAALSKYIDAIVAEPYDRKPWAGLSQWAKKNSATLSPPQITIPTSVSGKDGKTINVDAKALEEPETAGIWLAYVAARSSWQSETFRKTFPDEKDYRHSLAEEVSAFEVALKMLEELQGTQIKDPALKELAQIEKDGMLEAFVLISRPDEGVAKDYDAYRNGHREILRNYIQKYVIRR